MATSHNYDAIFVTDTAHYPDWTRGYAAHRLATHLRENGYTCLVVDYSSALDLHTWTQICELAIGPDTKFVGFSCTWWPYRNPNDKKGQVNLKANLRDNVSDEYLDAEISDQPNVLTEAVVQGTAHIWTDVVKKINPKTKIFLGGAKLDWYPDFPADHFFSGLSETQILDYLNQPKRIWPKLINHDTNASGFDWGWHNSFTSYTEMDQIRSGETLTLETTRGCRFKCIYCQFPLVGQKKVADYIKTKEVLYRELMENYERWGATQYWVADDTFNDTTEKLEHILDVVRKLPFKPKFRTYLRLDVLAVNPEQIPMLLEVGMRSCFFGIESFHPETAKVIGKGMSQEKRKQALYDAKALWGDQVSVNAGYIIGLPHEDYAHAKQQLEWFLDYDCPVHKVYYFPLMINPEGSYPNHPMSELDRNYQKYGYNFPDLKQHHDWVKNDGTDITTFKRAFEIIKEFNDQMDVKKVPVQEQIRYGEGDSIKDPHAEYFHPMINTLRTTL